MKNLLKIGLATFALWSIVVCNIFAQSSKSSELLMKAKQYETEKKYIWALGTYYDVMDLGYSKDAQEAYQCFDKIANLIASGKPGFGEYNQFTLHDNWLLLLKEAESYFSHNMPYDIEFSTLLQENINYQKRTADYSFTITTYPSEKQIEIIERIIKTGIKKNNTSDWGNMNNWPEVSAFTTKDGSPEDIYKKYRVAIMKYPNTNGDEINLPCKGWIDWNKHLNENKKYYERNPFALLGVETGEIITYTSNSTIYECAFNSCPIFDARQGSTGFPNRYKLSKKTLLYSIRISIVDSTGKEILKTPRILIPKENDSKKILFSDVDTKLMEIIDSANYSIKISEAYLEYGTYDPKIDDNETIAFTKNLPEIKIEIDNYEGNRKNAKEEIANFEKETKLRTEKAETNYNSLKQNVSKKIIRTICATINSKKTEDEAIQKANSVWKESYNSEKSNFQYPDLFPKLEENFVNDIYKTQIKNILIKENKKGELVLTSEGKKYLK